MNYFNSKASAEKYAIGRPDFHANTIDRIRDFLRIGHKLDKALDIACGTGLSTKALLTMAENVYGTDISIEMLNNAIEKDKIYYSVAAAEEQPFGNDEFDLITVSSGVHWFNIDAFLSEANRILKTNGWLVIYENFFTGEMVGNEQFKNWVDTIYLKNFPSPPRNKNYDWTPGNLNLTNFIIQVPEDFVNKIHFDKRQLINYFITQSNVIAVIEYGEWTYEKVDEWLDHELDTYFEASDTEHTFLFGNRMKYLQKISIDITSG